ncbi:MAG: hypothetical protein LBK97_07560, partial [Prevotellaceae bacterium]|nr:hypothetical protein [Prevotellaceae bacterium]
MKTILSFSLCLCFFPLSAQITRQNNAIRIGDEIIKQQVVYKDPGRSGENVLWDFSKLSAVNPEYILSYKEPYTIKDSINIMGNDTVYLKREDNHNELFQGIEHYTSYYYRIKNDTLYCMGHENPTTLLHYRNPLPAMPYPFGYGQKTARSYTAGGLYSSSDSILSYGNISIEFDALGKMILPSRDTLEHVMRIKKVQTIKRDSISRIGQDVMNTVVETCQWYSKGYRYPVFETVKTIDLKDGENKVFFTTAFFYPPQEHYYLEDDEENLAVLDSLASGNANTGGEEIDPQQWLKDNFMYNFYP